jgi:adenylate kinase family enzyme
VERISVVGSGGSGKTTLACAVARTLQIQHLELDSVYHQANWQPLEASLFRARVEEVTAAEAWVVDGNYSAVLDLVWQRADTVIWIDLPRRTVMRQLVARTLRRMATRQELWNGNTEPWRDLLSLDPARSIIVWVWTRHRELAERYTAAQRDPANGHLRFIRVPSRAAAARLIASLEAQAPRGGVAAE